MIIRWILAEPIFRQTHLQRSVTANDLPFAQFITLTAEKHGVPWRLATRGAKEKEGRKALIIRNNVGIAIINHPFLMVYSTHLL